ncbi:RNA recognition motif domain-containing protein [Planctomycetota bacterium]
MIRIYVGNMPNTISEKEVKQVFETFGPVQSVDLVQDKRTGKPWGYGFVSMVHNNKGLEAIQTMNNQEYWGRKLRVEQSRQLPGVRKRTGPPFRH